MNDIERAREILSMARAAGGGVEGLSLSFNGAKGLFTATVSIMPPRRRNRWRHGTEVSASRALQALLHALQDEL